jgi:hypothetical protein
VTTTDVTKLPYGGDWPRLTRFYGLSFSELSRMPRWAIRFYLTEIPSLAAEEQLARADAAAYPHFEEESAAEFRRGLYVLAGIEEASIAVDPQTMETKRALEKIGIKVVIEGA